MELRLGAGLIQRNDDILATRAGVLRKKGDDKYWIESLQKRYIPNEGDMVIGIITNRGVESFDVNLGSAFEATLPFDQFEGATKRNKPTLEVGDLVYTRVQIASKDVAPELTCLNSKGKAGEYGALTDGYMFVSSLKLSRSLLAKNNLCLRLLGKSLAFEMAAGMNGRVWVKSNSPKTTITICAALQNSEFLSEEEIVSHVEGILKK